MPTVMTALRPPLLYDYYGFPPESHRITWPAPGEPKLAGRVRELLSGAGFETGENAERGFDHGTFVPLKLTYPDANVPTVQLSSNKGSTRSSTSRWVRRLRLRCRSEGEGHGSAAG